MTPRKRGRMNRSPEPDPNRRVRATSIGADEEPIAPKVMHGEDLTSGEYAKDYKPAFEGLDEAPVVDLQYPSRSKPERFALVVPLKSDGYKPIEDITETVEAICTHYFPTTRDALLHESSGYPSRLKRAFRQQNLEDFRTTLSEFNGLVHSAVTSGAIAQHLDNNLSSLPLPLIERILSQTYARTVSPRVETVKRYTSGSDNVYGELLPRFVHEIFRETSLTSSHVFVDLGSGVGNVVLQAALERGCEAWGIEMMPNPSKLASLQASEIRERAQLWNISLGALHLIEDDFLSNPAIDAVLRRADVIVVNNKVFSPDLNDALLDKFLDLKEGTRVVSLQAFSDPDRVITERNVNDRQNLFVCQRREYWSGFVSWTDVGGEWFVQRKDAGGLRRFREGRRRRGERDD
ncbi:DOT1-domain-containing protein [Saccharata proteae CBS 121410]|uniref:Histone-lysine N-methyltransferase, H3 lysine-79 specific n=1 Tax=Saccharata proteae CBS 121410 TaxID=1314787 RepID=A0A9P4HW41_9PEZI|nr:DOT1-domain-containing protein [Saccharata proteae CBS 121410]